MNSEPATETQFRKTVFKSAPKRLASLVFSSVLFLAGGMGAVHAQTISGSIQSTNGVAIPGVTVSATRSSPFQQLTNNTDASGNYSISPSPSSTYTVTAAKSGYSFTPSSTNVSFPAFGGPSYVINFATPATVPTVFDVGSQASQSLDAADELLMAFANPDGADTMAYFQYGLTTNYGSVSGFTDVGSGGASLPFSNVISGLIAGTTYHFRIAASNQFGQAFGSDDSFMTATVFTNSNASLPQSSQGSVAWGDYDNDGRLDILVTGTTNGIQTGAIAQIWRNTGNGFSNINSALNGVYNSYAAWGDYDNDGRLDVLLNGQNTSDLIVCQLWLNDITGFTNSVSGLTAMAGSIAWGDYDNDGRLDLLVGGGNQSGRIPPIWRNSGNAYVNAEFLNVNAALPGVSSASSVAWGDYDDDGRLDILLTGSTGGSASVTQVWRNTGSGFTNLNVSLPGIAFSSVAWGDFDNDGLPDLLISGTTNLSSTGVITQVWRNTGHGFSNMNFGLPGVYQGSVAWGDYDNDGKLDILISGTTNADATGAITQVWRNTGSNFVNINAGLPGVYQGQAEWGDYDNDGRLDILLTGQNSILGRITQVWHNNTPVTNTPPTAPTGLTALVGPNNTVELTWNAANDAQTPANGLTYNLRVGTIPGGSDIIGPMADTGTGFRRVPQPGNARHSLAWPATNLPTGRVLYWSVQAVDSAFAGSPFATEQSFKILTVNPALVPNGAIAVVPGDTNGDGIVDQNELNNVLANYWPYSPWLLMTNVAGLGGTNVTFALTNSVAGAFSVEYSTNLENWFYLGPATPRYLFADTNNPSGVPQRFYRLSYP